MMWFIVCLLCELRSMKQWCFSVVMYTSQLFMIVDYEYVKVNVWWWICRYDLLFDKML